MSRTDRISSQNRCVDDEINRFTRRNGGIGIHLKSISKSTESANSLKELSEAEFIENTAEIDENAWIGAGEEMIGIRWNPNGKHTKSQGEVMFCWGWISSENRYLEDEMGKTECKVAKSTERWTLNMPPV